MSPEELDFDVVKSDKIFQKNYKLHDIAEETGKRLLRNKGFTIEEFGIDMREKDVWEAGDNIPDVKLFKAGKFVAYLDWKGKSSSKYIGVMNERSYKSYLEYSPCWVMWFLIKKEKKKVERIRCSRINKAKVAKKWEEWNSNTVVKIDKRDLVSFQTFLDKIDQKDMKEWENV